MKTVDYTLYFITNSDGYDEETFLNKVKGACLGGATIVQLREKNKSTLEYYELALKVKNITDAYNIPLIIDDRMDVAMAVGCGVLLGLPQRLLKWPKRLRLMVLTIWVVVPFIRQRRM